MTEYRNPYIHYTPYLTLSSATKNDRLCLRSWDVKSFWNLSFNRQTSTSPCSLADSTSDSRNLFLCCNLFISLWSWVIESRFSDYKKSRIRKWMFTCIRTNFCLSQFWNFCMVISFAILICFKNTTLLETIFFKFLKFIRISSLNSLLH